MKRFIDGIFILKLQLDLSQVWYYMTTWHPGTLLVHALPLGLPAHPKVFGIAAFHADPHRWHIIYAIQSDLQ